jgi:hypothetical protein
METITINELKEKLKSSELIKFSYLKVNGELREALGTLNPNFILPEFQPKDSSTNYGNNLRYFDIDKNGWRSISENCSNINIL